MHINHILSFEIILLRYALGLSQGPFGHSGSLCHAIGNVRAYNFVTSDVQIYAMHNVSKYPLAFTSREATKSTESFTVSIEPTIVQ